MAFFQKNAHRYPLTTFHTWMLEQGVSPSTAKAYVAATRQVLAACGGDYGAEDLVLEYIAHRSDQYRHVVKAAWRQFGLYLRSRGLSAVIVGHLDPVAGEYFPQRAGDPARERGVAAAQEVWSWVQTLPERYSTFTFLNTYFVERRKNTWVLRFGEHGDQVETPARLSPAIDVLYTTVGSPPLATSVGPLPRRMFPKGNDSLSDEPMGLEAFRKMLKRGVAQKFRDEVVRRGQARPRVEQPRRVVMDPLPGMDGPTRGR